MKIKIGDKITIRNPNHVCERMPDKVYTILDFDEETVKVAHPSIGGYFIFSRHSMGNLVKSIENIEKNEVAEKNGVEKCTA